MRCVQKKKQREITLDLLRVIASFAVVFAHVGLDLKNASPANISQIHFLDALVLWHVPCFVMISGRFFLDPEKNVTKRKIGLAIKRISIVFVVWNIIYQVYYIQKGVYGSLNLVGIICNGGALYGPHHFWYLWMVIPVYAVTPFFRKFTDSRHLMEYFIFLFIAMETLDNLGTGIPYIGENIPYILEKASFYFPLGFTGYYILGYYLHKYPLKNKGECLLYVIGGLLLIGMSFLRVTIGERELSIKPYNYNSPTVIIFSVAIFHFFLHRLSTANLSGITEKVILELSELSFGVYIVHVLLNEFMRGTILYTTNLPELLMRPIRAIIVFLASLIVSFLIRKIPIIGRKIT